MGEVNIDVYKKVLFGNQKQANVINDAVASIIASEVGHGATTVDDAVQEISDFMNECINHQWDTSDPKLIMVMSLIVGTAGANRISSREEVFLSVNQPSDSPKHIFRVCDTTSEKLDTREYTKEIIWDEMSNKDRDAMFQALDARAQLEKMSKTENFMQRAERIKQAILPIISEGVRQEIPDNEWAQALCCAEYYYEFHNDDVKPAASTDQPKADDKAKTKPSMEDVMKAEELYRKGASLGDIMTALGRPLDQVKFILKSRGFQVF